ncbi:MAG TPA: TRAP transporter large permease [Burkholderiaceae bacterium]
MVEALVIVLLFALIAIGVPIAVAILGAAFVGVWALRGELGVLNAALAFFEGATSFPLIAIPLFILAGSLMNTGGISRRLIAFVSSLIGFMRGGLAMVNVGVSLFFAEISGSAVADVAAIGTVLIPEMKRKGYKARFAAAVTSSSASLAIIIPPSIPMILYGAMANVSIVQLFVAGIIPGLLGGFSMMVLCWYLAVKYDLPRDERFSLRRVWTSFVDAGWALLLPVIILGGIFGGVVTATEGAGLAVLAALLIGVFIYREVRLEEIARALVDGVVQTATVMLLVAASAVLGLYITETQTPQRFASAILALSNEKWVILVMMNVVLFLIGMVLHGAAAIILVTPVALPLIQQAGIDPVHFGIILTLNIAVGQQTPPVASVLATACSIAKTDIWSTTRANVPFVVILLAVVLLVSYVPAVSLGLVRWIYG